ncbi:glycosyl hydrolase BNR repeat-containing protein [Natrinema pellirubrum DSM 15624]|uniref:Glycosyl hydrolase BNR repeat-containing protein n=1 Tax=Natrinema pellirubrum (strain DSM 15624 / CIP 106293 / JCM 10476 / NCIMB 786 / 157) TaxID=797303 RepID=L0JLG0_NATP1|nr:hypothetical protein [Natrinema pellirubrum]AGB31196.1 hypothetical protein Natpe_1291 [Natrinema pellirubrum DSM 15624]ELY81440.1 glycosyl hydrolase BNR repeat-containing protein [Natrinema pellirubrum DSM 15624]
MKLQTIHDGRVIATADRSVLVESVGEPGVKRVGKLPVPEPWDLGYRAKATAPFRSVVTTLTGDFPAVNIWSIDDGTLIASADRWLFRSTDGGSRWTTVRSLPDSSAPMGVLPSAVCVADGTVYLGEYPLDGETTPRILASENGGRTWLTAASLESVRHVHSVQTDPYTGDIWVTTGDADMECQIGRLRDGTVEAVGGGDQSWRAVELAFTPEAVLWGVDSVYTELKPIRKLPRERFDDPDPRPTTVHEVSSSVYYAETVSVGGTKWVLFSTAMEAGGDSTGPDGQTVYSDRAAVIAASSTTGFTEWNVLVAFRKRSVPTDRWNPRGVLPRANAYVFLASHPDRGVFVNPYNTDRDNGNIRLLSDRSLARRS